MSKAFELNRFFEKITTDRQTPQPKTTNTTTIQSFFRTTCSRWKIYDLSLQNDPYPPKLIKVSITYQLLGPLLQICQPSENKVIIKLSHFIKIFKRFSVKWNVEYFMIMFAHMLHNWPQLARESNQQKVHFRKCLRKCFLQHCGVHIKQAVQWILYKIQHT